MLDGIPLVGLSAPALLGVFVMMIFLGLLIPRRIYTDKATESERWRVAFETEREARQESDKQTSQLIEAHKTTHAVLQALLTNSEKLLQQRGADDVAS